LAKILIFCNKNPEISIFQKIFESEILPKIFESEILPKILESEILAPIVESENFQKNKFEFQFWKKLNPEQNFNGITKILILVENFNVLLKF